MIYFLEHDEAGDIYHAGADPMATIVPLINRISVKNPDGTAHPLAEPVGIDLATYDTLIAGGLESYRYDAAAGAIVKKEVASA